MLNKLKVSSSRIEVIYLPIDHTVFRPLSDNLIEGVKAKYGIKSRYILHVSTFSRKKNPKVLLRSFYIVKKQVRDITLVIAGSGWNNPLVQKLINELGLQGHVKVLGWVPRENLVALYNGAEVFLFPSLHETFGFPVVEAMVCGCPVVTSNRCSIPEVVGDAGIMHDPDDYTSFAKSIVEILTNDSLRKELIRKGLKRAKIFSWEKTVKEIYKVYRKVLEK